MSKFREDLEVLINQKLKENESDTSDFVLADYLADCLDAFDKAMARRPEWHGKVNMKALMKRIISGYHNG